MRSESSTRRFTVALLILTVLMTPCLLDVTSNEMSVFDAVVAALTP
jgi:hypothetical protein